MSWKETDEGLHERALRDLRRGRFPGDLNVELRKCDPKPGQKTLDVGCGIGWPACAFASRYRVKVLGIDASEYVISEARKRY